MTSKSRPKQKATQATELTEREAATWVAANKDAINRDLAVARKALREGGGKAWELRKFVTKARKRSAAKKK